MSTADIRTIPHAGILLRSAVNVGGNLHSLSASRFYNNATLTSNSKYNLNDMKYDNSQRSTTHTQLSDQAT